MTGSLPPWLVRAAGLAGVLLAAGLSFAGTPADDDPFSDANAAKKADKAPPPQGKSDRPDPTAKLIEFDVTVEPKEARRGQTVRLTITGTPSPGFHTYPITQRSADPAQPPSGLSQLVYEPSSGLRPLGPVTESKPEFVVEKTGDVLLEYKQPFTWSQDVLVLPDAAPGEHTLAFKIKLQVCDENRCVPGTPRFEARIRVTDAPALPLTPELKQRLEAPAPPIKVVPVPPDLPRVPAATPAEGGSPAGNGGTRAGAPAGAEDTGLFHQLFLAMAAGFIMLFTPCVFPMIPITVSLFLKQGEREHHSPLILAGVYCGTIITVLTLAVLVLGNLVVQWADNVWLNLAMGVLMLVFALSLFGMFELELPSSLTRFTAAREGQGGYAGVFFMALTFTINSFTCTGPFLGPLLSGVKQFQLAPWQVALSAVAYSVGFAGPFFFLALFPRLLKGLPRSGGWLNAIKVVMGFVELALALKFFSITDAGLHPGNPRLFNYDTVLCAWLALAAGCGLYLLGVFRLPHDTPLEHVGVLRLLAATFFLGLAVYMTPLLWRKTPLGSVGEFLASWLPRDSAPAGAFAGAAGGREAGSAAAPHLTWLLDYEKAWQQARAENKPLFIDFTGVNCQNCRYNEQNVFPRPEVRAELSNFVRVQLYTDSVPDPTLTQERAKSAAARYLDLQSNTFGDTSRPLYAVLDPSGEFRPITEDGKLAGAVTGRASGTINDVAAFVEMLKRAQGRQVAQRP